MPEPQAHHCLIDGSGVMHRAKAMAQPRQRARDGIEVGTAALFAVMMIKILRRAHAGNMPPTHWGVAFDPPREHTWRRHLYPAYKAHRPEAEPAFVAQVPLMKDCCAGAGCAILEAPGHEADDVLAAYAHDAHAAGARVTIVSSDKDMLQTIRPGVMVWDPRADRWYTHSGVVDKFGVRPDQMGDFLALMGDSSDGIPSAKGIGPVAARTMLGTGKTLAEILDDPASITKASWRAIVERHVEDLRLARTLVALDVEGCPRGCPSEALRMDTPIMAPSRINAWIAAHLR